MNLPPALEMPAKADWDPTHTSDRVVNHWTTTNLGEAVPGIITPLGLAHWGRRGDLAARRAAYSIGVISARERACSARPRPVCGSTRPGAATRSSRPGSAGALYQRLAFRETTWAGMPEVYEIADEPPEEHGDEPILGTGASAGVVEGLVRVDGGTGRVEILSRA